MKEKEWQKFAVQSVTLLAVVLIISFFFMGNGVPYRPIFI